MKLQLLVTTMNQNDLSIVKKMNISGNVIIANQCGYNKFDELRENNIYARMISTATIGTSRNRNIALAHCDQDTDIIMFSDDDLLFYDGYESLVIEEFLKHPEADAIKFDLNNISSGRELALKAVKGFSKMSYLSIGASGVCVLAIKRNVLNKVNLKFNECFGPGTLNYCGEDSIFLKKMLDRKINLYHSPKVIADIDFCETSWFEGYTEKYFMVGGRIFKEMFPLLAPIITLRSAIRFSKKKNCHYGMFSIWKFYLRGIRTK